MSMNRQILHGGKKVIDSYSILLDSTDPLEITYDEGQLSGLTLFFNFNLVDKVENGNGVVFNAAEDSGAASFDVDIIAGKTGFMSESRPIADSDDSSLYIFIAFKASKMGKINFQYTLYEMKRTNTKKIAKKHDKKHRVK